MAVIERVGIVGAGVIGAAWAARFAFHGVNVKISDPNPDTQRIVDHVFANARAAWSDLGLPEPNIGTVAIVESIAEAAYDAEHVQESVPEQIDIKRPILEAIDAAAPADVVIASSTSGIRPSELQATLANPERLLVGHPFNPVYLLPLVEVCGGAATNDRTVARAMELFASISMKPLHVRVEIDAFIADRLLEAMWREALWLVNDGVATTEEIDDAIRYGFGLRWAQMGVFESYRLAGGEGGLVDFIRQFGPTLSLPWTKLMNVPELTDDLVDRLVTQSDRQSGQYSIAALERIRDRNLVGMLRALEVNEWGAGEILANQRKQLGA